MPIFSIVGQELKQDRRLQNRFLLINPRRRRSQLERRNGL